MKTIVFKTFLLLFSTGIFTGLTAQSKKQLTLKEALNYAMENNRSVRESILNKQSVEYRIKEAKSIAFPQVNINGAFEDNLKLATQLLPAEIVGGEPGSLIPVQFGTKYNLNASVEANQMIYDQSYWAGLKAVKKAGDLNRLEIMKAKEEVAYQVALVYYQAQVTSKELEIVKANLKKMDQVIQITKHQLDNGIVKQIDYNRLLVNQINLQTEQDNLENSLAQQLNLLKYHAGMSVDTQIELEESAISLSNVSANEGQPSFQNRLDMQLLSTQKELEMLQVKLHRSGYYPSLNAFARYTQQALRNEFNFFDGNQRWFDFSTIGLRLNIPVFDGFQKKYRVQQSQVKIRQLELQAENREQSLKMEFENAGNTIRNKQKVIEKQQKNMQLAEEVYNVTREQFKQGVADFSELLNAENALQEAQTTYLQALIQAKVAELDYHKTTGNLLNLLN